MTNNQNTPQPDPAWDYYEIWHSLQGIKARIESGLKLIAVKEQADDVTDAKLKEILQPASNELEKLIDNDLSDFSEFF